MKNTILNLLLIFLSKKTRINLTRKLDLLSSLSGKRCLGCQKFLYDISFDNSFCPSCTGHAPEWIKYDLERQRRENKSLKFVTSLDPKFQLKIKKGIDKLIDKETKKWTRKKKRNSLLLSFTLPDYY